MCMRLCGNDGKSSHDGGARGNSCNLGSPEVWWRRVTMAIVVARVSRVGRSSESTVATAEPDAADALTSTSSIAQLVSDVVDHSLARRGSHGI